MSNAKLFLGGVPTQPDVDKLNAQFGVPEEGVLLSWESIGKACDLQPGTFRFNTVVNAWRKSLFAKHAVVMGAVPGKGLVRLDPNGKIEHTKARVSSGARIIRRAIKVAATTDRSRLTPENKKAAAHYELLAANLRLADVAAARGVTLPALDKD